MSFPLPPIPSSTRFGWLQAARDTFVEVSSEWMRFFERLHFKVVEAGQHPTMPFELTLPVMSKFAWVNQGSAVVTEMADGRIHLQTPTNATANVRARVRTALSPTFTLDAGFQWGTKPSIVATRSAGIVLRESSTGRLITFEANYNNVVFVRHWTSPTVLSATVLSAAWNTNVFYPFYMRIVRSGGIHSFRFSPDGEGDSFLEQYQEADTAFLAGGPDQYGHFVLAQNSVDVCQNLFHWKER